MMDYASKTICDATGKTNVCIKDTNINQTAEMSQTQKLYWCYAVNVCL